MSWNGQWDRCGHIPRWVRVLCRDGGVIDAGLGEERSSPASFHLPWDVRAVENRIGIGGIPSEHGVEDAESANGAVE